MAPDFDDPLDDFAAYGGDPHPLDTHALLWFVANDPSLPASARFT